MSGPSEPPALLAPWSARPSSRDVWRWVLQIVEEGRHSHREIAAVLKVPRARVSSMARTRVLSPFVRRLIDNGELSPRHGEVLLLAPVDKREDWAKKVRSFRWPVAVLRDKIRSGDVAAVPAPASARDPNVVALEDELSGALACPVSIVQEGEAQGGLLQIRFFDNETLDGILQRIRGRSQEW